MTTRPAVPILRHLRHVALLGNDGAASDAHLLEEYLVHDDADAFAVLVRRHGPMVRGVCRRILRDDHDADDAFQATFLVLIHKAATVSPRSAVANWLYGVAYRTAHKARVSAARRRVNERRAGVLGQRREDPATGQEVWTLLDRELNRLPEKYRIAVVVCDLEGKTRREAALQLGWPEGTVAGRLARGRALLARRLARRGVTGPAAALAAVAAGGTACTAGGFSPATASVLAAGASPRARGLAGAVVRSMGSAKLRAAAVVLAVVATVTLAGTTVVSGDAPEPEPPAAPASSPAWPPVPTAEQLVRYLNEGSARVRSFDCTGIYLDFKKKDQSVGLIANFAYHESGNYRLRAVVAGKCALDAGCDGRECWYGTGPGVLTEWHRFPLRDPGAARTEWPWPGRPEWMLESLGLSKLDPATPREVIARPGTYELIEKTETVQGQPAFKVTVFRRNPSDVQVPERLIRDDRGKVLCRATVREVFKVEALGKLLPRDVEWEFPEQKLSVRAKLNRVRIRIPAAEEEHPDAVFRCPADDESP
jgi:RNA polymerase sigma factor (sigma-70 family)